MIDYENLRLFHQHGAEWGELQPKEAHDPAQRDPERDWGTHGRLFVCTTCDEEVMVQAGDPRSGLPSER